MAIINDNGHPPLAIPRILTRSKSELVAILSKLYTLEKILDGFHFLVALHYDPLSLITRLVVRIHSCSAPPPLVAGLLRNGPRCS